MNLELEDHLRTYFERSDIQLIGDPLKEKAKVIIKDNSFSLGRAEFLSFLNVSQKI